MEIGAAPRLGFLPPEHFTQTISPSRYEMQFATIWGAHQLEKSCRAVFHALQYEAFWLHLSCEELKEAAKSLADL